MAKFAAILFSLLAVVYIGIIIAGLVAAWPWGIAGLAVLFSFVFLFGWVVKDRIENEEDKYYSENVDK